MVESQPVVVGVDGSEDATRALRWAADFAVRTDRALVVVHAWIWPFFGVPLSPAPGASDDGGLKDLARRTLDDAVAVAREQCPTLDVTSDLSVASPTVALLHWSGTASAVVIGSRGLGKVSAVMIGSVGVDLAGHTHCPLVVVRETADAPGPVLVGVDDSPRSAQAIEFAFREASRRGETLRAVHAWPTPLIVPDSPDAILSLVHAEEKHAQETLAALLKPFEERYPDVKVELVAPRGSARHHLVEASADAQLVVVGARGRGGFRGLLLGSTSHALLHHSHCPVAVVPHHVDLEGFEDGEGEEDEG